jgi:hypothetical protein
MKKSATRKLEEWLLNGKTITALQALNKWGCMRLSARINDLRNNGFPILTDSVKQNGKIFARYRLAA